MSRWGKTVVVPLDSLCKEKENTNRVARSVGTVGKWGKMGFTSTRTYALSALPAVVAANLAAAAATSPGSASPMEDDLNTTTQEQPKPKKFFKSRNAAPPEVIAQIIQHFPRSGERLQSPTRDGISSGTHPNTPHASGREPIKLKLPKGNSAERKKKSPKKTPKTPKQSTGEDSVVNSNATKPLPESKSKKKKEEKKLKPEAAPSRVTSRARKAVNYCEDDEDERLPTPIKDIIIPKSKSTKEISNTGNNDEPPLPPPIAPAASKTPEHPPIVLRISKGTSRLVSTDSEEQPLSSNTADDNETASLEPIKSRHTSIEDIPNAISATNAVPTTPKIIVKPPKPPSPVPAKEEEEDEESATPALDYDEAPEFNYCTVKISPDKPPKERLKLIIKTDVLRQAIAAAKAAEKSAAAAAAAGSANSDSERPEKEKKQKGKKHKHTKHNANVEQPLAVTPAALPNSVVSNTAIESEFKTPSPHISLSTNVPAEQQQQLRTVISPPATSERDFDSQSSVLGSISSKGNSTPQPLVQTPLEESRVLHSRGSSVITSDLETSQQSSLVAAPSDIESRLESMMMDSEVSQQALPTSLLADETSLQKEDIIAVLRGDEQPSNNRTEAAIKVSNEITTQAEAENNGELESPPAKRRTRGRPPTIAAKTAIEIETHVPVEPVQKSQTTPRKRGRKAAATNAANNETTILTPTSIPVADEDEEVSPPKRTTRRGAKKVEEITNSNNTTTEVVEEHQTSPAKLKDSNVTVAADKRSSPNKSEEENTTPVSQLQTEEAATTVMTRRGRTTRNTNSNNNSLSSNNNNINKIAASLSAKAGAAEAEATTKANSTSPGENVTAQPRTYGRKRKNQQVTQVLQPSAEEIEVQQPKRQSTPSKVPNLEISSSVSETAAAMHTATATTATHRLSATDKQITLETTTTQRNQITAATAASNAAASTTNSPPRHDYKVKDKFKRTLTLDSQVNCNAVENDNTKMHAAGTAEEHDEEQQRGSMKLVISKKKGSIFKSRAVQPDQTADQAAATKRHLYKHSWDAAEANGNVSVTNTNATTNDETIALANKLNDVATAAAQNQKKITDKIYDDFNEDLTVTRDSPALGKLTRVIKPNPQSSSTTASNALHTFDIDKEISAPNEITSVKVDRKAKEYYTVIRNVKTAHQIQEIGEYQEMDDDVEYILDALQPHNPISTRCLSALQLATKCMTPSFRMHVRAHSVVTKFFKALSDANNDLSLGLCTSAIMFILSQEGLNMDLDRDSLELMMNLLESEGVAASSDRANYERNKQKVRELCEEMKAQGKATHLNMESITVGTLAMETLLSLTSKRAGEWFKEELRELGGLEHIIKTISDCCRPVMNENETTINWTRSLLDNMQTVERCMRVLENVTQMNEENQNYMLTYDNGSAVNTLCTLYKLCDRELMLHPTTDHTNRENPGVVMRELLVPVMKVLINLTHTFDPTNVSGAEIVGQHCDVINVSFHLLLQAPNYIPDRCIFELSILALLLLINLSMYAIPNRAAIMKTFVSPEFNTKHVNEDGKVSAIQAIMEYFYKCEELARLVEKNTDAFLDKQEKTKKKQEEVDETVNNLLQKAGHHMEHTLKGSYAGILIGHVILDNEEYEALVRTYSRGNGFKEIVNVLEKYYTFMNLTASSEASVVAHIKSTKKLIDYFKKRDLVYEMNDSNDCALPLNLETRHKDPPTSASSSSALSSLGGTAPGTNTSQATTSSSSTQRSTTQRTYKTYSQR